MSEDRSREQGSRGDADDPSDPSDLLDTTDTTHTTIDTTSGETSTMSHDDSTNAAPQFSDPLADPLPDTLPDTTANPSTGSASDPDATTTVPAAGAPPSAAAEPDATTTIPAASTQALPTASPFRVEPTAPVPDDVVTDATQLPHLPPPSHPGSGQSAAWPPPAASGPAHEDPRPALVTVRKGPRPGSIMFGLLTMIVAAWLLAANLTDADLTFRLFGPPMIGAFGGMLLIVGLVGVVAGRLRR